MSKKKKAKGLIYGFWATTGLLSILMVFSAGLYIFDHARVFEFFISLGYPSYLVYPLALAKILGVIAITSNYSEWLKEWAYAGFFFDTLLAVIAHLEVHDGLWMPALVGLVLVVLSYLFNKKLHR